MIADSLLALGLVLATATQLRPGHSSVGPAELLLVLWLLIAGARLLRRGALHAGTPLRIIGGFWIAFVASLCIGTMVGLLIETRRDTISSLHDIGAYALLLPVSCLAVAQDGARERLSRTAWGCVLAGNVMLALQIANAYGAFSLSGVDPWFWDRLQGWSDNPNQLALLAAVLMFMALHVAERARNHGAMFMGTVCAVLPFIAGVLSKSDTFVLVCICCFTLFAAMTLRRWLAQRAVSPTRTLAATGIIVAIPLVVLSLLPFAGYAVAHADRYASSVYSGKDRSRTATGEGALRLRLWHAAVVDGVGAAGLGLGPGAHLVVMPYKREPPPKFEAHNTILDLFTQGGALAVLAVVVIWASVLRAAWRAHAAALATLACAIAVFSMFHLIIRQPMFWFTMALGLTACLEAATPPSATEG